MNYQPSAHSPNLRDPAAVEIECRYPECGWYVLIAPDVVDMPCPCAKNDIEPGSCPGKITATKHGTYITAFEQLRDLRARVARIVTKHVTDLDGYCVECGRRVDEFLTETSRERHAPDCALAALLKECEGG